MSEGGPYTIKNPEHLREDPEWQRLLGDIGIVPPTGSVPPVGSVSLSVDHDLFSTLECLRKHVERIPPRHWWRRWPWKIRRWWRAMA